MTAPAVAGGSADLAAAADRLRQSCRAPETAQAAFRQRLWRWLDDELAGQTAPTDLPAIEDRLRRTFAQSGGTAPCPPEAGQPDRFGTARLTLRRNGPFVEARAAITVTCGEDQSAALYRWGGKGWHAMWRGDATTAARTLAPLAVTPSPSHLILSVARGEWCTSNWHPVQYSLWRAQPSHRPQRLLERSEFAFLGNLDGPVAARLDGDDLYVELQVASLDVAILSRLAVRHYRIRGTTVQRADPLALTPVNFVEEWLALPWGESARWSDPAGRDQARLWHRTARSRATSAAVSGDFAGNALRCRNDHHLWQVTIDFGDGARRPRRAHFLVRWTDPYRFRMVAVSARPWRGCDDDADPNGRDRRLLGDAVTE